MRLTLLIAAAVACGGTPPPPAPAPSAPAASSSHTPEPPEPQEPAETPGADPAPVPVDVAEILARRPAAHAALLVRLVEAELDRLELAAELAPRHPRMRALRQRLALLAAAIPGAPADASAPGQVAMRLREALARAGAERAELARRYGVKHVAMVHSAEHIAALEALLAAVADAAPVAPTPGELLAARAEARGRLAELETYAGPQHPRVLELRAQIDALTRAIDDAGGPGAACASARRGFSSRIALLRGRRSALDDAASETAELDAALDVLAIESARAAARCED